MKHSSRILILIFGSFLLPVALRGDGMFYARDFTPGVPYQHAILSYHNGQELMILQSTFTGEEKDMGWVIPLPSVPKVGTIHPTPGSDNLVINIENFEKIFVALKGFSAPRVIDTRRWIPAFFSFIIICIILSAFLGKKYPRFFGIRRISSSFTRIVCTLLLLFILCSFLVPGLLMVRLPAGVEILSDQNLGLYDIRVVQSADARELVGWLQKQNYRFSQKDQSVFEDYIRKKWVFVTVHVQANQTQKKQVENWRDLSGMPPPLLLAFSSSRLIYPMKLTALSDSSTDVLLYLWTAHKMATDNRLSLWFASSLKLSSPPSPPELGYYSKSIETAPLHFWDSLEPGLLRRNYLTVFRAHLIPDEMKQDIVFVPAPDDESYRKTIIQEAGVWYPYGYW